MSIALSKSVLLMAYGSPRTLEEVPAYLSDIRGGRPVSDEAVESLVARYVRIGGPSPLNEITMRQAASLQNALGDRRVYVGMKHWHPFISDTVGEIVKDEVAEVVGLVLAPHYSSKSIGEYEKKVLAAREEWRGGFRFQMVESWWDEPAFIEFVSGRIKEATSGWDLNDPSTRVFFTAHSIPQRVIDSGDPYARQLEQSAAAYAAASGVRNWQIAWQSASATGEPWIGPDILDSLEAFAGTGGKRALIAPVGFTSDHLEILFDIDVECAGKAAEVGLEMRRVSSPNDDQRFIAALAEVVRKSS